MAFIGGVGHCPALIAHEFDVARSCLIVDLEAGIVAEKAMMITGR